MVSILVTMVIMIIISLIVIGFARVIRREQRQSLDRQLSTQAFYAAETGVSDAINALNTGYGSDKSECGADATFNKVDLDSASGISYTCLLIDQSPTSLEYDSISTSSATTIPISAKSGTVRNITLSWQDTDGGNDATCPTALGTFPANNAWPSNCDAGMLRVEIVPTIAFNRAGLVGNSLNAFLQPRSFGAGTLSHPSQGDYVAADCRTTNTPKICKLTITMPNLQTHYLRVRSIYKANRLTVTATDPSNNPVELVNAQALIDSTGKANDVLNRVVARVSISNLVGGDVPAFAIQSSDSLCKRLGVAPGYVTIDTPDPACQLN